ncbi:DUF1697 domain-containing protein [Ponticaulis sp.]|uniref:DUF1697 domain-containing protein n=1 Tax=Ponticaulis sp. TaxID=2020902 RepID=UPI000B6F17A0|nr:DUF1697 domain-containing protein [Ponticaulis sp.]MAI90018.1 hypothetical protein [Ponticaulis sp.]OUX99678.1 MAG: hypothetical protein CBB65_06220 [Hyphomonadaceae bacterium TMED5]|tara:strand:- start:17139 stop:17645 length:507 start_codon:yes stop_codon:yes gene_type:complete
MATHIAFLRAVNVGGTGKLKMDDLKAIASEAGFENPRTYIASGNLVFESEKPADAVRIELEQRLLAHMGHAPGVIMRGPEDIDTILTDNPFPDAPGNKVVVLLLDAPPEEADISECKHLTNEVIMSGKKELYIWYPDGKGKSKLKLPGQARGTARNMNTFQKVKHLCP